MILDCGKWRELASEYIEGTLAEPMARAVGEHARTCDACRAEDAALRALFAELNSLPEVDPPLYFHENVMAAIARQPRQNESWWQALLPRVGRTAVTTALAGCAAAALLFALVAPGQDEGIRPVSAGQPAANLLPGGGPEVTPAAEPRLRISRRTLNLPDRGTAYSFTFWLENGEKGTARFDIAGERYRFNLDNARREIQVPFDVAAGKPTIDLSVAWTSDGKSHSRYIFLPLPREDGVPQPDRQAFGLPSGSLADCARALATRYGVPITLDDVAPDTAVTLVARDETAEETLRRTLAPLGLSVAASRAGLLVSPK